MKINIYFSTTCLSGGTFILLEYARRLAKLDNDVRCYFVSKPMKFGSNNVKEFIRNSWLGIRLRMIKAKIKAHTEIPELNKRYPDVFISIVDGIDSKKIRCADAGLAGSWPSAYMLACDVHTSKKLYLVQDYEDWDAAGHGKQSYLLPIQKAVISKGINDKLMENLQIGPYPVVYNGIDFGIYNTPHRIHKKNASELVFSMLYSDSKQKGCKIGIDAFEKLREDFPDVHLIMFGIPEKPHLNFEFEYHQNAAQQEVVEIYQVTDIFIWPTLWEGWGLTPVEAMACGCAVAGSNVASMNEVGKNEINALLSSPGDADELYQNLKRLVIDSDLRNRVSGMARSSIQQLSWDVSVKKIESLLGD